MNKKFKSISAIFMAICMAITMSSTSLFMVVADAIEQSEIEKVQENTQVSEEDIEKTEETTEDVQKEQSTEKEQAEEATKSTSVKVGWYDSEKTSFVISTEDDLVLLSRIVNGTAEDAGGNKVQDSFKGKTIVLESDINFNGLDIESIGTKENPFEGTFNGQNNTIKGIKIVSDSDNQGIFGYNKGTIKKLKLSGKVTGKNYVGTLVVFNEGKVQDIDSEVVVNATGKYVGGIVAKNSGTVERCTNVATIDAEDFMGGIVGYNEGNIKKCSNSGTINCWGKDSVYDTMKGSGGIAGVCCGKTSSECSISDCYNTGKIYGHYDAGGITGWTQNCVVQNCYNTGYVEAVWDAGGITGAVYLENAYIKNCYNTGEVKVFEGVQNSYVQEGARYSYKYSGGITGFFWGGHIDNCYNSGNVFSIEQGGGIFGGDRYNAGGTVSNCITTGEITGNSYIGKVFGYCGGAKATDCQYFEPTEENYATIASLLNSKVSSENGYLGWKNNKEKFSFTKVYEVSFGITPSDAKLIVKDSEGNILTSDDNIYTVPNGTYTYEVSKDEYATKTGEFTIDGANKSIGVKLAKLSSLWDGESADTTWYNESDSSFKISNNNQLAGLLKLTKEGNDFAGKTIVLSHDLDLNDKEWAGIGTFNGTFDGAGYAVKNINGSLFNNLGQKAIVVNACIEGNGSLVNNNNGRVENSYNLSDNNLVITNNATVKNCYVKSSKLVVKEGTQAVDSYYMYGNVYTEDDFANSKIADLLNKNVNTENNLYYSWDVVGKETKLFKLANATFDITGEGQDTSKAVFTLYDSDKNEIKENASKNYKVSDRKYKLSVGTYTYKITCTGYEDKTGTVKIKEADVNKSIKLNALFKITINTDPSDAVVVVKDSEGNKITANEDGSYYLTNGTYSYEVSKNKFYDKNDTFTVDSKDQEISVKLEQKFNVKFVVKPETTRNQEIKVYKENGELVEPKSEKTYELKKGKYTYKASAGGYDEVSGEFELVDTDLELTVTLTGAEYDISWYDSTKDSFEITNEKELAGLAAIVNGQTSYTETFKNKTIVLANDIKVSDKIGELLPIGSYKKKFQGTFNGNNHSIDININITDNSQYVGLFGCADGAKIYDLTVKGNVSAKSTYVGGIVGYAINSTVINNCINEANITGKGTVGGITGFINSDAIVSNCINKGNISGSDCCGGIVGNLSFNGYLDSCINEGNVSGESKIGGITGYILRAYYLINSYNKGQVTGTSDNSQQIGGIAGYTYRDQRYKTFVGNCYNLGEVKTSNEASGGIVGESYLTNIMNCYNIGNAKNEIIAKKSGSVTISNCYFLEKSENQGTTTEGIAKTKAEFENGDVAKLLNKGLTADNKFKDWKVDENKVTTFGENIAGMSFTLSPSDAKVELKDSEGNVIKPITEGVYSYYKNSLESGKTYTYTVSADRYEPQTKEITYDGNATTINVTLSYISTEVSFKSNVDDLSVLLYQKSNKKLVTANENGTYTLLPGDYYYYASSEKYPTVIKEFTVEPVKEATKVEIDVQMTSGYKVSFDSNATTKLKVTIKNSEGYQIPLSDDWSTYELLPGTYTYTAAADGFETISGSDCTFTVTDSDLDTISLSMNRIYDVDWYNTDKTEFTITTKDQLVGLVKITNGNTISIAKDNFAGKTIKLGNDIELNSSEFFNKDEEGNITVNGKPEVWTAIGAFQGTFDGQNYTISGLYNRVLFNSITNGTLKNLKVSGYMYKTGGGIINTCTNGTIENCVSNIDMDFGSSYATVGGIVSYLNGGTIVNCVNNGNIVDPTGGAGIVRQVSQNAVIKNCQNNGEITQKAKKNASVASIASTISSATIENCSNTANLKGQQVGGIVHTASTNAKVENCSNSGKVTSTSKYKAGGIAYTNYKATYNNNYYNSDYAELAIQNVTADVEGQNTGKTTEQYANGDVASLLNANVTAENGYKPWTTLDNDAVLAPENCNLIVNVNVKDVNIELKDAKGNIVKPASVVKNAALYSSLATSGVYTYTVSKDGFDTEKGTVTIKDGVNSVSIELGVTVYVTISKDGEFKLSSDESIAMSRVPVKVTNFDVTEYGYDDVYNSKTERPTLLNAFILTHKLYSEGVDAFNGIPNNSTAQGNDLYITKFWNEETTQLSYMVNNKFPGEWLEDQKIIWGSSADNIKLRSGDDVNVTMYTDYQIPMFYTYFKDSSITVRQGEKVDLELLGFNSADAYLNPESKGISGSTITIDGEDTNIVTDKNGKASISFDEVGTYTISAKNTDLTISDSKAVITAPVCTITVKEKALDITFDADNGTEPVVKTIEKGETLDFTPQAPVKEGYTFVGWYKDTDNITTEYKKGTKYTKNITYKAKWAHVEMLGAQGKLIVNDESGIRFGTKLYNDGDKIVEKGTLIIPANLLAKDEALTLNTPKVARSIGKVNYEVNQKENYVTYLGTIVGISKTQFERKMTAASYVIYKDKAGNEYTVYSPYKNGSISVFDLLGNDVGWKEEW